MLVRNQDDVGLWQRGVVGVLRHGVDVDDLLAVLEDQRPVADEGYAQIAARGWKCVDLE